MLVAAAAVAAVMSVAYVNHVLGSVEDWSMDKRFAIRGSHVPKDIAVVAIDDRSLRELGPFPFPRRDHAIVIRHVADAHPRAIAVSIQFIERTDQKDDNALERAVGYADALPLSGSGTGRVVLATAEVNNAGETPVFGGGSAVADLGARVGWGLYQPDSAGVIRKVRWGSPTTLNGKPATPLESFPLVAAELATGQPIPRSRIGTSTTIAYVGAPGTVPRYSYTDVLHGRVAPSAFRDKVVVIGATAALNDAQPTPYGAGRPMDGVEITANAVETALHGFPLRSSRTRDLLLIVLFSFLVPVASLFLRWRWCLLLAAAAAVLYLVAAQVSFDHGVLLAVTWPLLALALGTLLAAFLRPRRASRCA
jgi:CHASE2 domain-containing sensor protein